MLLLVFLFLFPHIIVLELELSAPSTSTLNSMLLPQDHAGSESIVQDTLHCMGASKYSKRHVSFRIHEKRKTGSVPRGHFWLFEVRLR